MHGDNVTVLHPEIVADYSIYASITVFEVVVCQDNKDGIFSLLAFHQDCISAEQL